MDNKINEAIINFECRHCDGTNKLSSIKEKYDDVAVVEILCLKCLEKEVVVI